MSAAPASRGHERRRAAADALTRAVREHSLLIGLVTIHLGVAAAMPAILGRSLTFRFSLLDGYLFLGMIGLWVLFIVGAADIVISAIRARARRPLLHARRRIVDEHLKIARWIGGVMVMALLPLFTISFSFLQALAPLMHKIDWDPTFADWDRRLHFGRAPWEWLQPLLGHPPITSTLSMAYASWFFVLYGVMFWQAFSRRDRVLRMQFFLSQMLIWIMLGNVLGTLLLSGGPVYFGRLTGLADPFAPLMAYLHEAARTWPNVTLSVQARLWDVYLVNGEGGVINGAVMAMPSLHVAAAFSLYLVGRATHPVLGWVLGLFTLTILVATVHLGWHYAIDGYAGMLGAWAIWHAVGFLLRRPWLARRLWLEPDPGSRPIPGHVMAEPALGPTSGTN
jgi:membrane-associated phospholipid phosphatase